MIFDSRNEFADAVSVAHAAGTVNLGNVIDLEDLRDIGVGDPDVYLVITVDTTVITGGAAGTIQFQLVSDAVDPPDTGGTASVHFQSPVYATGAAGSTDLVAGDFVLQVCIPLEGVVPYERYLGVQYIIGTTTTTAGAVNAFLTFDAHAAKSYADAVN